VRRWWIGLVVAAVLAVGALAAVPLSGYDLSRIRFDGSPPSAEKVLAIRIPWRAKQIKEKFRELTPYGVTFLMPEGRWREHVTRYVPEDRLRFAEFGADRRPAECTESAAGAWAGRAPFFKTSYGIPNEFTAVRSVSVVPDCQPGWALVSWTIREPGSGRR